MFVRGRRLCVLCGARPNFSTVQTTLASELSTGTRLIRFRAALMKTLKLRLFSKFLLLLSTFLLLQTQVVAQPNNSSTEEATRPRIGLVLSGGGARGFAHIGVLRALREMRVPIDIVVGTSMGCVVGGAYAAGRSVEDLELFARSSQWDDILTDRPMRDTLTQRRREDDVALPSRLEFGLSSQGLTLPPAAAGNAELEKMLRRLLPEGTHDLPVNRLPLPFRSIASDLLTGDLVELSDSPLLLSMRASLSIPGIFSPVRLNQRLLVDGGLVRNLPVDIARSLGAQVVIAVNVGTPLAPEDELRSSVGVAQQMLRILTEQNVQRSLKELGPDDILVAPDLKNLGFLEFGEHEKAMNAGAEAVRRLRARLIPLALSAEQYAALELTRHRLAPVPTSIAINAIEVSGAQHINPKILLQQSGLKVGDEMSAQKIQEAAARLYGRGDIAHVDTEIRDAGSGHSVLLNVSEADWARSRLRLGLEFSTDFSDNHSFSVAALHVASSLNNWGGELRTFARVGSTREFNVAWWQPLGPGSRWYIEPTLGVSSKPQNLFTDSGKRESRILINDVYAQLVYGYQLSSSADLRLGVKHDRVMGRYSIPDIGADGKGYGSLISQFVELRMDSLDSLAFPTRGQLLQLQWRRDQFQVSTSNSTESSEDSSFSFKGLDAFKLGNWAGHIYGEWGRSKFNDTSPNTLGGFLRLSGTEPGSIDGTQTVLGRFVLGRHIGNLPQPFGGAIRAGFSLELGGVAKTGESLQASSLKQAGSGFISVDTRFGPLYFAVGATRGTGGVLYLFLGPVW